MNSKVFKILGPGILFASTAIGVSHLVQSTRAGADYGFTLLWAILLANLFKYPFFEFGSRYASTKGKSIIDGYAGMSKWMLYLYLLITIGTMFFVSAAVCAVTAGFLQNLFGLKAIFGENSTLYTNSILIIFGAATLILGKYKTLDSIIKLIGITLLISTLAAFTLTLWNGPVSEGELFGDFSWKGSDALFLIALMGWMPTAVDLSAWNSLWTLERIEQTNYKPSLKETIREFNFGYLISAFLSVCFLTLGTYIMFDSGETLSGSGAVFASQVVTLFTSSIGEWSYIIIAAASFSIMLGTFIAVMDGYGRALSRTATLVLKKEKDTSKAYNISLLLTASGAFGLIYYYLISAQNGQGFKSLVDVATTLSFLVAPFIAIANYSLVTNKDFPAHGKPPKWLRVLSVLGILFLVIFSIFGSIEIYKLYF
ncbi:MAG: divalent metal cation transporter [Flavobacteriales bacterium]|jgi:Mn2+/Fe2+ NRAMP family transporter